MNMRRYCWKTEMHFHCNSCLKQRQLCFVNACVTYWTLQLKVWLWTQHLQHLNHHLADVCVFANETKHYVASWGIKSNISKGRGQCNNTDFIHCVYGCSRKTVARYSWMDSDGRVLPMKTEIVQIVLLIKDNFLPFYCTVTYLSLRFKH